VLPIATAGSSKHLLAIDYALKPVLSSLGATQILSGFFCFDNQLQRDKNGHLLLDNESELRFEEQVRTLLQSIRFIKPVSQKEYAPAEYFN